MTGNRAIDLFAGAGGLSLGLKMAGWNVEAALEFSPDFVQTHRLNMPETRHICDDVRDVDFDQFKGIDLLAGGPPCQPFSVSGKQLGKADLRDMIPEFVRAVRECQPRFFMLENVSGLATPRFIPYLRKHISALERLGYEVHWKVLDAADYGVPQKRLRLFVVGTPPGVPFAFPAESHGPKGKFKYVTVRQALLGCDIDEPNLAKVVYAKTPVLRRSPFAGMLLNGKGRPLDMDMPSKTIPATAGGNRTHVIDPDGILVKYHAHLLAGGKPRCGEVGDCRRLTVRESARLQSFPDWFQFTGRKSQRYCQIGNAVPPLLAKAVGEALMRTAQRTLSKKTKRSLPEIA